MTSTIPDMETPELWDAIESIRAAAFRIVDLTVDGGDPKWLGISFSLQLSVLGDMEKELSSRGMPLPVENDIIGFAIEQRMVM